MRKTMFTGVVCMPVPLMLQALHPLHAMFLLVWPVAGWSQMPHVIVTLPQYIAKRAITVEIFGRCRFSVKFLLVQTRTFFFWRYSLWVHAAEATSPSMTRRFTAILKL